MIVLDSYKSVLSEGTSKGNQLKLYRDGYWVKLDNNRCSEGLAEEFVSLFCDCIVDFPHVRYKTDRFLYKDDEYLGCYSYNMHNDIGVSFISFRNLLRRNNIPLNIFIKDSDTSKNIINTIDTIGRLTGVNISNYLFRLLFLDALIINEDRHYMNIGLAIKNNKFYEAECFDNGSSLFCTNWTYRKSKTFEENIASAKSVARPFSKFFDTQVLACIKLGAKPLYITKNKLDILLKNYYNNLYSDELNSRIKLVLTNRLNYYTNTGVYLYV